MTSSPTAKSFTVDVPVPTISIGDPPALKEGNNGTKALSFTVTLSKARAESVTVAWNTANGTAVAGEDYTTAKGNLTFSPGETSRPMKHFMGDWPPRP